MKISDKKYDLELTCEIVNFEEFDKAVKDVHDTYNAFLQAVERFNSLEKKFVIKGGEALYEYNGNAERDDYSEQKEQEEI